MYKGWSEKDLIYKIGAENQNAQSKLIGIIVPIFNVKLYLRECLDSICKQTYTNLSIVLVNDGSRDESLEIAKEYALKDERILIIDKENGGLSSARNVGIEFFSGEYELEFDKEFSQESDFYAFKIVNENALNIKYILKAKAFFKDESKGKNKGQARDEKEHKSEHQITENITLEVPKIDYLTMPDSDDFLSADYVEWNLKLLLETKADVAFNRVIAFYDFDKSFSPDFIHPAMGSNTLSSIEWLKSLRNKSWEGGRSFINFSYLQKIKLKYINFIVHEDHHFDMLLAFEADLICFVKIPMYYYRMRSGSIMDYDRSNTLNSIYISQTLKKHASEFKNDQVLLHFYRSTGYYYSSLVLKDFIRHYKDKEKVLLFDAAFTDIKSGWGNEIYMSFDASYYELITRLSLNLIFNYYKHKDYSFENLDDLDTQINENIAQFILKNIRLKDEKIQALNHIIANNEIFKVSAVARMKNHLAYKRGEALIMCSKSFLGILSLPFVLKFIETKHKKEQAAYEKLVKDEPDLAYINIKDCSDYKEALKVEQCFTYQLGLAYIKARKTWYKGGFFKFYFEVKRLYGKFKKSKENKA